MSAREGEAGGGSAPALAALGAALLATAALLALPGPLALQGDNASLTHPLLVDAFRQLRRGAIPVWTTGRWGGSPLAGDPVVGALYAPFYLGYALTPFPHWRALDVALTLHLTLLAAGTARLLVVLGARPLVAVATAMLVALNPTMVFIARSWAQYWAALTYWPWLFAAAARVAVRPARGAALVGSGALAAQVYAGYPQFALYSGTAALAWIVLHPGPARLRRVAVAALIGAGAVAMAAPQVLPGLGMAHASIRGGPAVAGQAALLQAFALAPATWLEVASPKPISWILPCRIAPGILLLAALGLRARPRFPAVFLFGVFATAGALATGATWPYRALHAIPPFSFFGGPVKLFYLAAFAVVALAGLGLERIVAAPRARTRRLALAGLVLMAAPALGAAASPARWAAVAGAVAVSLAPEGVLGTAVVVVAVAESAAFLVASQALTARPPELAGPFAALLRDELPRPGVTGPAGRYLALTADHSLRQVGLNFGALWGVEALNGVGPLAQWRQLEVLERARADRAVSVLRQWGAGSVIVVAGSPLDDALEGAGFRERAALDGLRLLTSPGPPPPRYQLVPDARAVSAEEAIEAARVGSALTDREVLVEDPPAGSTTAPGDAAGRVEVLAEAPGQARLRVDVARQTWLVAREPFYANWCATVDARSAPIRPAGGFFLGVPVEAGLHEVTLTYREPGLRAGVQVAVLALLLLPALLRRLAASP